jgi:hypothetical protein
MSPTDAEERPGPSTDAEGKMSRREMCKTSIAAASVLAASSAVVSAAPDEKPEPTFRQDGDDLVVTTTLTVNISPHVVLTEQEFNPTEVHLSCCVVQASELAGGRKKKIEVEWRLARHKKGEETYRVEACTITLQTPELKRAVHELQELMRLVARASLDPQSIGRSPLPR